LSDKLHTFPEIEADMTNRGFRKKGGRAGMQGDQAVPITTDWALKDFAANEEFIIAAQNKGAQYLVFTLPTDTAPVVDYDITVASTGIEIDDGSTNVAGVSKLNMQ
ncbi:hypothetical protein MHBO_005217, partial [Bonamia ostreae]